MKRNTMLLLGLLGLLSWLKYRQAQQALTYVPGTDAGPVLPAGFSNAIDAVTETIKKAFDPIRAQIEREEGRVPYVYKDSRSKDTFGVGHLVRPGELFLYDYSKNNPAPDSVINDLFDQDSASAKAAVDAVGVPLNDNQRAALVSLAYNIGNAAFADSDVVTNLKRLDYAGAAAAFRNWRRAGDNPTALLARREREIALFQTA